MSDKAKKVFTPLTDQVVEDLRIGDRVLLSGIIYTARDAAHIRLVECIEKGEKFPFEPQGQVIYYVGPTPARPGQVIGSAGPTTAYRMSKYAPKLIVLGIKGFIGKGAVAEETMEAMKKYKAVYFLATGGTGVYISQFITKSELVCYEDLGAEAVRRLEVKDMPVIVAQDCWGGNLFVEGRKKYSQLENS